MKDYEDDEHKQQEDQQSNQVIDENLPHFKVGDRVKLQHGKTGVVRRVSSFYTIFTLCQYI